MKRWHGVMMRPAEVDARHRDGRPQSQVYAAVRASSQKKAAAALGVSLGELRDYFQCDLDGPEQEHFPIPLLLEVEPGTVVVEALDPGGTVNGQTGWIIAGRRP